MNKPAILMICPQFHPLVGGYERSAKRICAALAARGLRVVVITERRKRAWPALEIIDGYTVRRLPCLYRRHLHSSTSLLSFAGYLLRHGREFDTWHVHQYGPHAALAVALGKLLRRPVVLKMMNSGAWGIGPAMGSGIAGRIMASLHRRVSACLAITEETRQDAVRFGIAPERIHRVPNGVDGSEFRVASPQDRNAARRALGLSCERLVLSVGRLSPEKNQLGLLDAWAAVDGAVRDGALLALLGEGPDWEQVQARAQKTDLAGSVQLAGMQSDMACWYRAADLLVIASHHEGLANVMLEAMASGLPVISTRVSGSSVLLEPPAAGLVVDVDNVQQLSDAMETLLRHDSTGRRLGLDARSRFEARFSIESVCTKMISVYEELRGSSRAQ